MLQAKLDDKLIKLVTGFSQRPWTNLKTNYNNNLRNKK